MHFPYPLVDKPLTQCYELTLLLWFISICCTVGSDYAAVNTVLDFSLDGETLQCFDVTVYSDSVYEGSEEFSLSVSSVDNHLAMLDNQTVTVTILDDDGK